ncbi:MAG: DUF4870 domain-containing protein [bacterium]
MDNNTAPKTDSELQLSQQEIDSGKTMAILSYLPIAMIGLIVSIVVLVQKNNDYAIYHAKQALTLSICALVAQAVCFPLIFICIGGPLMVVVSICALVLFIIGIINASGGVCKPLPLIGPFAAKMFGNIRKA